MEFIGNSALTTYQSDDQIPLLINQNHHNNIANVSKKRKIGLIIFASLFLFFSGIFIGFVPIKNVILKSGIYSELEIDLSMTVSMTLMSVITFPIGLFMDKYGSKRTAIVGAILQMLGHVLVALCLNYQLPAIVFIIALSLDSLANPFVFTSIIQFTRLFPDYENLLMGYFTGLWDLSAILGFIILIFDKYKVDISATFWASGALYLIFLILIVVIFPKTEIPKHINPKHVNSDHINSDHINPDHINSDYINPDPVQQHNQNMNNLKLFMIIFTASTNILSMNYYMINFQNVLLIWDLDVPQISHIIDMFSIAFPLLGFLGAMGMGALIQKYGVKWSIICMIILQILFCTMSVIPIYQIYGYAFFPYILYRMVFFTSLNVCVTKINPQNIGLTLGLVYGISSLINLSNYGFSVLAIIINDDYFGYCYIHIGTALLALMSTFLWLCFLPK